jgi:hypothetical protein
MELQELQVLKAFEIEYANPKGLDTDRVISNARYCSMETEHAFSAYKFAMTKVTADADHFRAHIKELQESLVLKIEENIALKAAAIPDPVIGLERAHRIAVELDAYLDGAYADHASAKSQIETLYDEVFAYGKYQLVATTPNVSLERLGASDLERIGNLPLRNE